MTAPNPVGKDGKPYLTEESFDPARLIVSFKTEDKTATSKTVVGEYKYQTQAGEVLEKLFFKLPFMLSLYGAQQSDLSGPPTENTPWSLGLMALVKELGLDDMFILMQDAPAITRNPDKTFTAVDRLRTFALHEGPSGNALRDAFIENKELILNYIRFLYRVESVFLVKANELFGQKFAAINRVIRVSNHDKDEERFVTVALKFGQTEDKNGKVDEKTKKKPLITQATVFDPDGNKMAFKDFVKVSKGAVVAASACMPSIYINSSGASVRFNTYKIVCKRLGTDPADKSHDGSLDLEDVPGAEGFAAEMEGKKRVKVDADVFGDEF